MPKKPKPEPAEKWEDEGDSHSCTSGQVWQTRSHQHADGNTYAEQCQPMGGGTYSWRPI